MTSETLWIDSFRSFLRTRTGHDPAHDLPHIERVVLNTRHLAAAEKLSLEVLLPAAYLHDCLHVPKDSPLRSRASALAADHAISFLQSVQYPAIHLEAIHHAITAHSFSANIPTETPEARVLQDADRLDALGAIGLSRCLMLGGHMDSSLYHLDDPFCENRSPEDARYCLDHFYAKLLTLADTMQTKAGRALARERTAFLKSFLAQLKTEIHPR